MDKEKGRIAVLPFSLFRTLAIMDLTSYYYFNKKAVITRIKYRITKYSI